MNELDQKINTHFPGLVVRKDLVKTVTLHTRTDNSCQILQCHLKGIIHSGYQQEEYEEGQDIDLPLYQ